MTDLPTIERLFAALDATWPAEAVHQVGPWLVHQGKGAGNRVAATTAAGPVHDDDITTAEAAQRQLGQSPLFMIRPGDEALDELLAARGYRVMAPTLFRVAPVSAFPPPQPFAAFPLWPPLAIVRDIWEETGITAARQAVMARVQGPATAILARPTDEMARPSGVAFVAVAEGIAMIHALEVLPHARRQGCAGQILMAAADWAARNGAEWLALAVTAGNEPAAQLYSAYDMAATGGYHYRSR